jgi:hypothetical protein
MDYELPKQLKDAGWPQNIREGVRYFDRERKQYYEAMCYEYSNDVDVDVVVPTLEELIEGCADFYELSVVMKDKWQAVSHPRLKIEGREYIGRYEGCGSTAVEAVARLWLALHANGNASA